MKKTFFTLIVVLFFLGVATGLNASTSTSKDVMVLYNGTTEINRETMNFLKKNFASDSSGWILHYTQNPAEIKAGQYRAVIVLNTGLSSGVDPKFTDFMKSYPTKKEVILVSLIKGNKDLVISHTPSDPGNYGVDTFTAASVWSHSSTGSNPQYPNSIEMHVAWVKDILQILKTL